MVKPLQAVIFISALLVFIFTVVYRMVKSASFSNAMATLIESLLIVSFFIFFGILLSYLVYFLYQRFRQGSRQQEVYNMFDNRNRDKESTCTPDARKIDIAPDNEVDPCPDS